LLWPGSARVELDLEELVALIGELGFVMEEGPTIVPSEYTSDDQRLMRYVYEAVHLVARKRA
jgi:hypothetical protein